MVLPFDGWHSPGMQLPKITNDNKEDEDVEDKDKEDDDRDNNDVHQLITEQRRRMKS